MIFFEVNTLPVKKEQIKVKLLKYRSALSYDLKVQKIDKKERRVYVVLPATYKNGQYRFKATFDKEEVESGVFTLDSSEIVMQVLDNFPMSGKSVTSLATTDVQTFKTLIYANAEALKQILKGELSGPKFDIVVLNAMFALYCADVVSSPAEAKPLILEAIGSGKVYRYFENYVRGDA